MKAFKLFILLFFFGLSAQGNNPADSISVQTDSVFFVADYMPKLYNYALIQMAKIDGDSATLTAYTLRFSSDGVIKSVKKHQEPSKLSISRRKDGTIFVRGIQKIYYTSDLYKENKNRGTSDRFCEYISPSFLGANNREKITILEQLFNKFRE